MVAPLLRYQNDDLVVGPLDCCPHDFFGVTTRDYFRMGRFLRDQEPGWCRAHPDRKVELPYHQLALV